MTKQARILAAVAGGAETAREIEAETGLPLRVISSTLTNLHRAGLIRRVGPGHHQFVGEFQLLSDVGDRANMERRRQRPAQSVVLVGNSAADKPDLITIDSTASAGEGPRLVN